MKPLLTGLFFLITMASIGTKAGPGAPPEGRHPGSKVYPYSVQRTEMTCQQRAVSVFLPTGANLPPTLSLVVFGHGQALDVESYRGTLEHLAKKGVAAIHPAYDTGFFDQNWTRMGTDFVTLTDCVLAKFPQIDADRVIFAGHSKGAYVASIAAGIAFDRNGVRPKSVLLFEPAGADTASLPKIGRGTSLTVVFSDSDTIVKENLSRTIFEKAGSATRQFIHLKSYPASGSSRDVRADHFWPLTKGSSFGGGPEGPLHYYGSWKWLVAAARDLENGADFSNPYLYGDLAADKGVDGLRDGIERSW